MAITTHAISYTTPTGILVFPDHYVAFARTFSKGDSLAKDVEGRKIIKAGTLFPSAVGVVFHDVDVTDDDANGAIIIHGFIKTSALPEEPSTAAVTALNMIKFMPLDGTVPEA
jgi:hypothetical protein